MQTIQITKAVLKGSYDVKILPRCLRGRRDIAVCCGCRVQIDRTEAGDTEAFDIFIRKIAQDRRDRHVRRLCRNRNAIINFSILITDGTYHLCTAGFQSSNSLHALILPLYRRWLQIPDCQDLPPFIAFQ